MTNRQTLAHLSDLHIGAGRKTEARAIALSQLLMDSHVDHVVVTGDITHRGRREELERFRRIFAPWIAEGKLTAVPGNHDCLGDGLEAEIMGGPRVSVKQLPGLHLVLVNSTGPHNRSLVKGHGMLTPADIEAVGRTLDAAPPETLAVVLLHHHVLPLPSDHVFESLFRWVGWPFANELDAGTALLRTLAGRCDLVLHGHRHQPVTVNLFQDNPRPVTVCNAGSSTALGSVRVFTHRTGGVLGMPEWLFVSDVPETVGRKTREKAQPSRLLVPELR